MTAHAKIFKNGRSQAVRLPQSCRFPDDCHEVTVRREGRRIILEMPDQWSDEFLGSLGSWDEEIPRPPSSGKPPRDPFAE